MANINDIIKVNVKISDQLYNKLSGLQNNKRLMTQIHQELFKYCRDYVPEKAGVLNSTKVSIDEKGVKWDGPYAHYQWYGEVYGPNPPVFDENGKVAGWHTRYGTHKTPTGRPIGVRWEDPERFPGWTFGYTKPNTGAHWEEIMLRERGEAFFKEIERIIERNLSNEYN